MNPTIPAQNSAPAPARKLLTFFWTREESRQYCAEHGIPQRRVQKNPQGTKGRRWYV